MDAAIRIFAPLRQIATSEANIKHLLANAGDTAEVAERFLKDTQTTLPTVLDQAKDVYDIYPRNETVYAPFPVNIVIDQLGVIQYLSYQHDLNEVSAVIERLLEDNG